jgi:hypothetical protein
LFGRAFYRVSGILSMATVAGASDPAVCSATSVPIPVADRHGHVQRLDERYADRDSSGSCSVSGRRRRHPVAAFAALPVMATVAVDVGAPYCLARS